MKNIKVQLVPGYMKLDKERGMMVPTYPPSYPGSRDAPLAPIVSLAQALSADFEAEKPNGRWYQDGRCFIMQCVPFQPNPRRSEGPRLAGKRAWEELGPITMQLLLTDVDAAGKKEPGFDIEAWWRAQVERGGIGPFLKRYPGAFIACSRGGLRIYQVLDKPYVIDSQERADDWKQRYISWVDLLSRLPWLDVVRGSPDELKDWTRLQRIPHDTRDGIVQDLPTIGDPENVGTVELPDPAPELKPRTALRPYTGPTQRARVKKFVVERVAAVLPRQGDGVHDAAFALGGIMSAAEWETEDCAEFVELAFHMAGITREDIRRTAQLSVEQARAGQRTYAWRRFVDICRGDLVDINLACGTLRTHIPGLDKDAQWYDAIEVKK